MNPDQVMTDTDVMHEHEIHQPTKITPALPVELIQARIDQLNADNTKKGNEHMITEIDITMAYLLDALHVARTSNNTNGQPQLIFCINRAINHLKIAQNQEQERNDEGNDMPSTKTTLVSQTPYTKL
ncbi:MAG: hypothetical protein JRI80_00010 [Deltaproteobacteria bacterium]|nr:hypothetical protein [Deltaproteobacteria bacterium]